MLKYYAKQILPSKLVSRLRAKRTKRNADYRGREAFSVDDLRFVLKDICGVKKGDTLFVHSSTNGLALDVAPQRVLAILQELVGPPGTLLMPSYPKLTSYLFLKSGQVWNVRRTPSYSGFLTEVFRRATETRRSLHPTKSVAAQGPLRDEMIAEHHASVWPYSEKSPYGKFVQHGGKAIGLGVSARYIAFIHTIDDHLRERFPARVYYDDALKGKVVDYAGEEREIATMAHDLRVGYHPVGFLQRYVPRPAADSFTYKRREFFYADARAVFDAGVRLAEQGVTIYQRRFARRRVIPNSPVTSGCVTDRQLNA